MCGVLGIFGKTNLLKAADLLLLLTHRGQDASGLLWRENGLTTAKAMGSPAQISLPNSESTLILGSTRYPTSGKRVVSEDDLETFVGPFHTDDFALTHNGNITNMATLCDKHYDCDSEFLTDLLAKYLSETNNDLVSAIRKLDLTVDGAYSLIGIHDGRLFAYRDSHGFKPLVFGRSKDHVIVASESEVLDMAGVKLARDVYPGELLVFSDGNMESYSISQQSNHTHCFFEYVYFAHPAAIMENQLVYDVRFRLGRSLAQTFERMHLEPPDYVVPVPDTSRPAAQALAEALDVPMREIILKNRYLGRTFIAKDQISRDTLAKNKYIYLEDKIRGKSILVVDDSIVRGTTAKMIVSDLRARGAATVYFAVTCPPQSHPCYYGIDISTDRELIASQANLEEIAEYINADALIYQNLDGLINAIGITDLCLACLDGEYPTDYARYIRRMIHEWPDSQGNRDYERVFE